MKLKYFLSLCLLVYLLSTQYSTATIRYVSKTGSSTFPYTTWGSAADSIQKCINICVAGDTVYVANGVYKEQVVMIPGLSLIGAGMDSCLIDTRQFTASGFSSILIPDSCLIMGFNILVSNTTDYGYEFYGTGQTGLVTLNRISLANTGILIDDSDIKVYNNICANNRRGILIFNSNSSIRNNTISTHLVEGQGSGIHIEAFSNNYNPIIDSNYIEVYRGGSIGIRKSFGTRPIIANNIIKINLANEGIYLSSSDSANVFNNLLIVSGGAGIAIAGSNVHYLKMYNNFLYGGTYNEILHVGYDDAIGNNVYTHTIGTVYVFNSQNLNYTYNNVWDSYVTYSGFTPDSTNLSVDPMVVNEDTAQGDLDFHLQKYSPLIDAGDPNILDRDGSRSDIGLYGGPYGWSYTYNDLAPRPPHNVTALIEDGLVKLTWNKNTEADFSHYRIYRDTVSILIYDSTRIVGVTSDTVFYDNLPPSNTEKNYYYLITAFDNQGNQSAPSEQINVTITGMTEHPPIGFDNYALLSNYPNPFNPSTIIPYRLKEAGYVKLYIYDMKGELVKILVNQWQDKGYYEVVFHPSTEERKKASNMEVMMGRTYSDLSSGVYLYQIIVRGEGDIPVFSDMGKMILLK